MSEFNFCGKNDGIGDRGERRRRSHHVWQRRVKEHMRTHRYWNEYCTCTGQAILKETPCRRSYPKDTKIKPAAAARLSGAYALPRDLRQVLPEVCTSRDPKKSAAHKPNVRQFPLRHIMCWHCGVTIRTMTGPDPASAVRSTWGMDATYMSRRANCARCIAIMNGLELPRAA